ncbi:MAG: hypothetical protein F7C08_01020 [Desulfurococcales archaeon]|nr:hypothetical protein [Desulfurococcales archaeon]MCE4605102.1 hypothetical protein [Desulfurococcales archaeon]
MDLLPLFPPLLAVSSAILAIMVYRRIVPYDAIKTAIDIITEYRVLERGAKGKRAQKKLKTMEPEYRKARRLIFRSTMVKFLVLTSFYIAGGLAAVIVYPLIQSPYSLPLVTTEIDGITVVPTFMLYFLAFIYASLVYRKHLL